METRNKLAQLLIAHIDELAKEPCNPEMVADTADKFILKVNLTSDLTSLTLEERITAVSEIELHIQRLKISEEKRKEVIEKLNTLVTRHYPAKPDFTDWAEVILLTAEELSSDNEVSSGKLAELNRGPMDSDETYFEKVYPFYQRIAVLIQTIKFSHPDLVAKIKQRLIATFSQLRGTTYTNWKEASTDFRNHTVSTTFLASHKSDLDVTHEITASDAQRFATKDKENTRTVFGSSFATDDSAKRQVDKQTSDGSCIVRAQDGYALAIADGWGHFHGEQASRNKTIGRAAYFAAKTAARLMSDIDPNEFLRQLPHLKNMIARELAIKTQPRLGKPLEPQRGKGNDLESTTLACVRAVETDDGKLRLVGFNIGDSMLIAYDPVQGFRTLAPARTFKRLDGKFSPAALPNLCADNHIYTFDRILPNHTVVFGLTDGVWDYLPKKSIRDSDQ